MRGQIVALAAVGALALLSAPAVAEVTVASGELSPGSSGLVSLAVSTDRMDAGTSRVEVRLPTDREFSAVAAGAKPGWDATLLRSATNQVTGVLWSAQSEVSAIRPGSFETFTLQLGPVPADTDRLTLSAVQTYSDGLTAEAPALPVTVRQELAPQAVVVAAEEEKDNAARVATGLVIGGLFLLLGVAVASVLNRRQPAEPV